MARRKDREDWNNDAPRDFRSGYGRANTRESAPSFALGRSTSFLMIEQVEEIPFIKGVDEDIKNLEQRIHEKEHRLIVSATSKVAYKIQKQKTSGLS